MSFYFRKLRGLRLMPTARRSLGFDFSTRANEYEREKTASQDGPSSNSIPPTVRAALSTDSATRFVCGDNFLVEVKDDKHLLLPVIPPASAMVLANDLLHIIDDIPKSLRKFSSDTDLSYKDRDAVDFFPLSVKPVRVTSDDILVNPLRPWNGFCDDLLPVSSLTQNVHRVEILPPSHSKRKNEETCSEKTTSQPLRNSYHQHLTVPASSMYRNRDMGVDLLGGHSVQSCSQTLESSPQSCGQTLPSSQLSCNHTLQYSAPGGGGGEAEVLPHTNKSSKDTPSPEQMHNMKERLQNMVVNLFKGRHDYSLLHKNVTLENNLFGENKVAVGTTNYALALLKLRLRVHARYSSTGMEILNVSTLEQNGTIRIHWRLQGVPQTQLLKFWRFFQIQKEDVEWLEAFSYFHIGKDGLVHKHRIDRMLPDNEKTASKLTDKLQTLLNPAKPLVS